MERPNVSSIKKGDYVILENTPCKVDIVVKSKIGKHGHSKVNLTTTDCIAQKNKTMCFGGNPKIYKFKPVKRNLELMSISDDGKNITIDCFDERNEKVILDIHPNSQSFINQMKQVNSDIVIDVSLITLPVPTTSIKDDVECDFEYINIIESFAEQKE